jgi:MFS family permease
VSDPPATSARADRAAMRLVAPLALAQFMCSFAGSNMNVMINDMSKDLDTTVQGIQGAITVFLLVMAALMIPGGKLTDRWGRQRCLVLGLAVYGLGAAISAVSPGLPMLIVGNSILEGVGTALLIPPVYILTTMLFTDLRSRAKAFGIISGMGGVGAAAGPLLGGLIATALSWRAAFAFQAIMALVIALMSRSLKDPVPPDPTRPFDVVGTILSAGGLVLVVIGVLQASEDLARCAALIAAGLVVLAGFFLFVLARERAGREALLSLSLFRNRTSNLGMITQNLQWLVLMGASFVVSAYLQVVRGYNPIETGGIYTAATVGVLASSLAAQRLADRHSQRSLVMAGFALTAVGIAVFLGMVDISSKVWAFGPGLLLLGLGVGTMLTPSVNIVQSSFGDDKQGEISGLSRSVSNLGSSLGTAIAGTILVANLKNPNAAYAVAMVVLMLLAIVGLLVSTMLPRQVTVAGAGGAGSAGADVTPA